MKVVVVDDDGTMRKVLAALFESEGHQVVASLEDGSTLLDITRSQQPDMVCLDYNLPGRNGLELLIELQQLAPDTDVLLVTGSEDPELTAKAADAGACGFLRKPFSKPQILAEIREVAQNRTIVSETREKESNEPKPESGPKPEPKPLPAAAPEDHKADPAPPRAEFHPRTAVVVDDNGSIRLLMKGILEGLGIRVVQQATNGIEGLEAAKRHYPQLVCLDVDMPHMTGLEALPKIREACTDTTVVMVTGNADRKFVEAAVAGGARGYVIKPVRPAHLETVVKKLLGLP